MALIRDLGTIRVPQSYRRFLMLARQSFQLTRRVSSWDQYVFLPDSDTYPHPERSILTFPDGDQVIYVPRQCEVFTKKLSGLYQGRQEHIGMNLVSSPRHQDIIDDQKNTIVIIPIVVSSCHRLWVEGESRAIKPGHIYAFNQEREHSLDYVSEYGEIWSSKPCTLLSIAFLKK